MNPNRYAAKVDQNQGEIIRALERFGFTVADLSRVGGGILDLLISRAGQTALVEVKTRTGRLTQSQIDFMREWQGKTFVVRSIDDALDVHRDML